ncbi:hypothetical protein ACTXJ5_05805 [Psychrobacter alimentarius]|uniref:hypothetical protein n=1 Tax=Psychrobacter alimentarius TaxID=261164 RepID=UPI003FCF9FCF
MPLPLSLYCCRDSVCIATDENMVNEHLNRDHMGRKFPVNKMPEGSVILHNNKPYGIDELTSLVHQRAKTMKLDLDNPFSIIIDDRFIK